MRLYKISSIISFRLQSRNACKGMVGHPSSLRTVTISAALVLAMVIPLSSATAQAPESRPVGGKNAFLASLSKYEEHAADPAGDLIYATELIRMTVSHVSRNDLERLARRLASADQAARHDGRKYIPETAIATAFNGLMAQVQDNHATPFRADAQTVHSIREVLAGNSPKLTSVKEHRNSCLPDEAVLLAFLLKLNNGKVVFVPKGQPMPPSVTSMDAEDAGNDADTRLDQYLAAHSMAQNTDLFIKLLDDMGI